MTVKDLHLAEIVAWDPSIGATRVLYFANRAFTTRPSETPASTYHDVKIIQPLTMRRDAFDAGTTSGRGRTGYGDIVLANDDGALDYLLPYAFDGRAITVRRGAEGAAYPSGFDEKIVATMEQPIFGPTTVTIKLRDRQAELEIPLQATKYLGDNVLPDGLEGVAEDLKGKPKPVCLGAVTNISPPCVNTSKLIYQVHDGAVASIDGVYDRGIPLSTSVAALNVQTSGFGATTIRAVAYGNGLWVAVGDAGKLYTSPDAITWTVRTSGFGATNITGVIYAGTGAVGSAGYRWLTIGDGGTIGESTDGITWNVSFLGFGAYDLNAVCFGNGRYVVVGNSGAVYSAPATYAHLPLIWTTGASGFGATHINAVAYGAGLLVAVGDSGTATTSADGGLTFTANVSGITAAVAITAITYGGGRFLAGNASGDISVSTDGKSYSTRDTGIPPATPIRGVAYGIGSYVYVGDGGEIGSSSDTVSWSYRNYSSTALYTVGFGNDLFVLAGASGLLLTSVASRVYSTLADLLDDLQAPTAGTFGTYVAGGYFRLGSSPEGTVTADVTQGASAADRTAAALYEALLLRGGKTAPDYDAGDLTALDTANSAVLGFWADTDVSIAAVIDQVAGSVSAFWGPDRAGVFRIKQLIPPGGAPVARFTANDLKQALVRLATNDRSHGLPSWSTVVRWGKSYTAQTTDLAAGVTTERRALVGAEWRSARAYSTAVHAAHLLAAETTEDALFTTEADALIEASRRQEMRGVQLDRFELVVPFDDDTDAIELGDVIELWHDRYGLNVVGSEDGQLFTVLGVADDTKAGSLTLSVWGESQALANRITDDGEYRVTDDGFYLVTS